MANRPKRLLRTTTRNQKSNERPLAQLTGAVSSHQDPERGDWLRVTVEITTAMIKELRDKTGAGIMDAKRALESANGDLAKAEAALFEKGVASAAKRAGRETREGAIASYIHSGGRIGAMVELNCETDFVARTAEFQELGRDLAMQVAAMSPKYKDRESVPADVSSVKDEELLVEQDFIKRPGVKIGDLVKELGAKTGENIQIGRFARFELGE